MKAALLMLLQAGEVPAVAGESSGTAPGLLDMLPMFLMMGLVFYFMLIRPQKRQAKEQEQMLAGISKHDQVRTAGGIIGKVAQVDTDKQIVVLTIDDSKNVRMRVAIQSIAAVLTKEESFSTMKEEDRIK